MGNCDGRAIKEYEQLIKRHSKGFDVDGLKAEVQYFGLCNTGKIRNGILLGISEG